MSDRLKIWIGQEWCYVIFRSGKIVIQRNDLIALIEQSFAQVRANKTSSTSYQDSFFHVYSFYKKLNITKI
ncbi:hypothetical protein D3C87_1250140 [compost metagenome]